MLLILIIALGSIVAGAIVIRNTVNSTTLNLRRNMPPLVAIMLDDEQMIPLIETYGSVTFESATIEQVQAIGSLPEVNFYDLVLRGNSYSRTLEGYTGGFDSGFSVPEEIPYWFELISSIHTEPLQFSLGFHSLVSGRFFESSDLTSINGRSAALVSSAFAAVNGLSVGSVIELYELVPYVYANQVDINLHPDNIFAQIGLEFEIIGIYDILEHTRETFSASDFNRIFVPPVVINYFRTQLELANIELCDYIDFDWWFCQEILNHEVGNVENGFPFFVLNDSLEVDEFIESATPFLPELQVFETTESRFDDIATVMGELVEIANLVLFGAIVAAIIILSLVITLFMYDRRQELGIYIALGEKRRIIIKQLLVEVVVVTIVGITISLFIGSLISSSVSQEIVNTELVAIANQRERDHLTTGETHHYLEQYGIPMQGLSVEEMMAVFDTNLNPGTIALFFVVGIGTVGLSTIVPLVYIVKLEPKKVLL